MLRILKNSFLMKLVQIILELEKRVGDRNFKEFFALQYRKFSRTVLTLSYVMIKLMYVFVAVLQIYLMNVFCLNKIVKFFD